MSRRRHRREASDDPDVAEPTDSIEEPAEATVEVPVDLPSEEPAAEAPAEGAEVVVAAPVAEPLPIGLVELPKVHEPSGKYCTLAQHFDGHGACIVCEHCQKKIRPQHMNEDCPARS